MGFCCCCCCCRCCCRCCCCCCCSIVFHFSLSFTISLTYADINIIHACCFFYSKTKKKIPSFLPGSHTYASWRTFSNNGFYTLETIANRYLVSRRCVLYGCGVVCACATLYLSKSLPLYSISYLTRYTDLPLYFMLQLRAACFRMHFHFL